MTQAEFLNIVMPFKDKVFRLAKRLLVSKEEAESIKAALEAAGASVELK